MAQLVVIFIEALAGSHRHELDAIVGVARVRGLVRTLVLVGLARIRPLQLVERSHAGGSGGSS